MSFKISVLASALASVAAAACVDDSFNASAAPDAAADQTTQGDASSGIDASSADASASEAGYYDAGPLAPPRPIAPLSTATVSTQTPTLTWVLPTGVDGAQVEVCKDRACAAVEQRFVVTGTSAKVPVALAPGVHFWRLEANVRLGIGSPAELGAAYDDVAGRLGPAVSVSTMVEGGVELALGVVNDVQLGPLVLVAAGGVLVEVLHDRALAVPPLDEARASTLVEGLRVRALLAGVRGQPAADLGSVTDAVVALSVLACELGDAVDAIDVNPLVCGPAGAVAVDALVVQRTHR